MPSSLDSVINLFPLQNYTFRKRKSREPRDVSIPARLLRLKANFPTGGIQITVMTAVLVHQNNIAHVLVFQRSPGVFVLPGCELEPNETEESGLKRLMRKYFGLVLETTTMSSSGSAAAAATTTTTETTTPPLPPAGARIIDLVANWWRPNFEPDQYPYVPAHISKPKELTRLYLISLPERCNFTVPARYEVVALPLFEIYTETKTYGQIIASLPQVLSRFNFNLA